MKIHNKIRSEKEDEINELLSEIKGSRIIKKEIILKKEKEVWLKHRRIIWWYIFLSYWSLIVWIFLLILLKYPFDSLTKKYIALASWFPGIILIIVSMFSLPFNKFYYNQWCSPRRHLEKEKKLYDRYNLTSWHRYNLNAFFIFFIFLFCLMLLSGTYKIRPRKRHSHIKEFISIIYYHFFKWNKDVY